MPPPPGKGKGKKGDAPSRKTKCPVHKEKDGMTTLTYEWAEMPKLYVLSQIKPASKAQRKVKEFLESEFSKDVDPKEAVQMAVSRGNTYSLEVLLQCGIDVADYIYKPPLSDVELAHMWKDREAKKQAAAEEAEKKGKKK